MGFMKTSKEALLFFAGLVAVLFFQFRGMLAEGHYLYLAVLEDPASLLSLYPWEVFSARLLHSGHFPLWNHLSGTGMPHLANLQSSVLNPLKWGFFAFPGLRMLDVMVIARTALGGAFTFLFARHIGYSRSSAALAGFAFALSGYVMKHFNQVSLSSEIWLPALLLLIHKQFREAKAIYFVLSSVVFAVVFCGGNPEAAFYVTFLGFFYAVFIGAGRDRFPGFLIAGFFAPFVAGGLLACAQLLPFLEYLGAGWHIHDPELHKVGAHSARFVTTLVAPWVWGMKGPGSALLLVAPYLGASVLFLAMVGASAPGRTRHTMFFTAAAVFLLSLVYNSPPLGFVSHVPPFDRSGNAKFAMAGASLFVAFLAGNGLESLRRRTYRGKSAAPLLAVVSMMVLGGGAYSLLRVHAFSATGFAVPFLSIAAVGFVLLFQQRTKSSKAYSICTRAIVLVCVAELMLSFSGYDIHSAYAPERVRYNAPEPPPELLPVKNDPGLPRFTGTARLYQYNYHHHSLNLLYNVADIRAFEAMYPEEYVKAMATIESFTMDESVKNFFSHGWSFDIEEENLDHPLVDRLGVKYIISKSEVSGEDLELVQSEGYRVYRNSGARPRAFMEEGGGEAKIVAYGPDKVVVRAEGPGTLVLADTGFPGWRAMEGEEEMKILPGLLRKVELGGGLRTVSFIYDPAGFRVGLWTGLSAALSIILLVFRHLKKGERTDENRG